MISVQEAIKIFKAYRPSGFIVGGRIVDGFGYVFDSTECYIDDSVVIVGFDGEINHLCVFPPDPSEDALRFDKAPSRRIPVKEFKPAGRVLFSYHNESSWDFFEPGRTDGSGFELYYDGSLYLTDHLTDLPLAVKYELVCKCPNAVKLLKNLFATMKDEIESIPEDIFGCGCDGDNDYYKFGGKKVRVYMDSHPVLSRVYRAALDIVRQEYPKISEFGGTK